ncbi:hypothetical protein Vafri_6061 [Volvox africanus]|nr:hypothetical protein Vafri_6061 [Volvox africanus]
MDEILRAKKLTEEILARAASIQTHMAQVNRSMANMALIEEEHKARGAREAAAAAKPPLRLMDLPDDLLRLIAAWAGVGGGRRWVSYLGSGTSPGPDTHGCGCGASSLAALAITCRRWRRLAAGEPELWKEMCRRRWGITERDAAEVLVLDPRQLHLAAGWPKAALGSAVGGTGGAAAAARTILASVRGAAGAAAAAAGRNGRVEAAGPARRALGTAAAATGSSGAACRSRIPPITASPPRPRGPGQHVSAAAEAGSSSSTGGGGGGGSGGSRRQLLPALASSGSTGLSLQPPLKSPPPSSPSRLPRAFGTMPAGRSPPSLCPGAVAAGPSVLLAPLSIPTSPETSPETSPGFGTFERFGKRTLIQETDGSGRGPGDDATSVPASPTGPQDSQLGAASQALNPPIPRSPPGASDGSLPGPTAAAAAAAATKTAALTRSSVTAAAHAAPRVRGALPATGLGHKGYAAASLASPPSPPPLLPGGDSLEPTPLWCVLQLQGDTGTTSGGGGGGSEGEKARTAAAVTTTTSCVVASASGQEAGSIGPNLWQLVYRDRLVGWRGVLAVFRWLQLHGCPEAVSGSLHRQQLLLALRYLHINIGINEGAGGGGNGAAPTAEAAEATGGGLAAEAVSSHQRLDAQPRVTEALAAELLLAAPDMVPCLLSLLSNDSGLVVELAAAGLADFLALDQARLDQERAAAEANRAAAAAAAAARAGGGGAARDAKARPRLRVRSDEPSIAD